ncbi:hypothetical protein [Flavitalea sp.]|nr:hypothetical protein [Flavitalea sp.]
MSKTLYNLLIFFLAFSAATGLFHGILYWQLGPQMFWLDTFIAWFSALNILILATNILMLKYFYSGNYMAIFYAGIVSILLQLCYISTVYKVLISGKQFTYSAALLLISILANIIYAFAVLFANIKNQLFLKASAITAMLISMFHGARLISPLIKLPLLSADRSGNSESWIIMIGVIPSLLLIVHFVKQNLRLLPVEIEKPSIKRFQDIMLLVLFPVVLCTAIFGVMIAIETSSTLYWKKRNDQQTSTLFETFEARRFTNKQGEILRYRLLKPLNYDSSKFYPLVISLPYGGQPGTDTIRQIDGAVWAFHGKGQKCTSQRITRHDQCNQKSWWKSKVYRI